MYAKDKGFLEDAQAVFKEHKQAMTTMFVLGFILGAILI